MKSRVANLLIYLPWITGAIALGVLCSNNYRNGLTLVKGMHSFQWMFDLYVLAVVILVSMLAAIVGVLFRHWKTGAKCRWPKSLMIPVSSILVWFVATVACSSAFFAGRDAAYRGLDHATLYKVCRSFSESSNQASEGENLYLGAVYYNESDNRYGQLPPEILALSPRDVVINSRVALLMLDGGGPMYHEGIAYVIPETTPRYETVMSAEGYLRVDDSVPAYMFRLYDYHKVLTDFEDAALNHSPYS